MWLVKKDFPLPEGPRMNLLRLVMVPVLHRQVGNIQMDGFSGQAVHHADAERRERILVGGLPDEQAQGLLDKGVETLLGGKSPALPGIAAQNRVGTSTVLWRGLASINASWLPVHRS